MNSCIIHNECGILQIILYLSIIFDQIHNKYSIVLSAFNTSLKYLIAYVLFYFWYPYY